MTFNQYLTCYITACSFIAIACVIVAVCFISLVVKHARLLQKNKTIRALLKSQLKNINHHKNIYNEIIALTGSLTDKITNITQLKHSIVELLAKQLGSGVVSIMLISRDTNTETLNIDAAFGMNIKRLQDLVITEFENLILFHKKTWGYRLASDNNSALTELGIGLSLNIPLMLNGKVIGGLWVGFNENSVNLEAHRRQIIQGITEHAAGILVSARHTEDERKTNLQANHFLIGLSHDLKTPGTSALYGLRDILGNEQNNLTDEQLGRLKLIEQSLEQQLSMVSDVLEYAKLQKGLGTVYKKDFSAKTEISRLLDSFNFLAGLKNISFNTDNLEDVQINFDLKHFQRIIGNLLSNAIKYSPAGEKIRVAISADNAEISITDSGIGIPKEEEEFLFQEFSRLKNGRHVHGSGFGLALCRILAELNSAEVFYRRHTTGSEFGLKIKSVGANYYSPGVVAGTNSTPAKSRPADNEQKSPILYKTILIIDDDPIICKTNLRFLSSAAEKFLIANSLEETKNILNSATPDLIVTDLNLQDGQFTDLLSQQDRLDTRTPLTKIPTIILTGYAKSKEAVELEQKHGALVLEKPTTRQELLEAVETIKYRRAI